MLPREITKQVLFKISIGMLLVVLPSTFLLLVHREDIYNVYINMYTAFVATLSTLLSLQVVQRLRKSPPDVVRPWVFLTTGLGLWALAEIIWFCYILIVGHAPEISVCDFFWLFGYLPLTVGLWEIIRQFSRTLKSIDYNVWKNPVMVLLVFTYTLIFLIGAGRAMSIESSQEQEFFIIETSYVLLDILLIVFSLAVARIFKGGITGFSLTLVATGFSLLAFADLLYTLVETSEFILADILYALSYVIIAIGILVYLKYIIPRML